MLVQRMNPRVVLMRKPGAVRSTRTTLHRSQSAAQWYVVSRAQFGSFVKGCHEHVRAG
jgi:hypothetical protein